MRVCMCALAGTRACDNCSNAPSKNIFNQQSIPNETIDVSKKPIKQFTLSSCCGTYEKTKNRKSK